jgi:hypothetical protein
VFRSRYCMIAQSSPPTAPHKSTPSHFAYVFSS